MNLSSFDGYDKLNITHKTILLIIIFIFIAENSDAFLTEPFSAAGSVAPRVAAADWDGDGDMDLILPRGRLGDEPMGRSVKVYEIHWVVANLI